MPWRWAADIASGSPKPNAVKLRGDDARVAVLALVDRDRDGLAAPAQHVGDEAVRSVEAVLSVDQEHDAVGLLDGARRLPRHELEHAARRLDEAAGVDDDVLVRLALGRNRTCGRA